LVVGIWFALGIVFLIWLTARHPERIRETGRVFLEEPTGPSVLVVDDADSGT
jgi:hypothetical protein